MQVRVHILTWVKLWQDKTCRYKSTKVLKTKIFTAMVPHQIILYDKVTNQVAGLQFLVTYEHLRHLFNNICSKEHYIYIYIYMTYST